jgi:hypothetical protein
MKKIDKFLSQYDVNQNLGFDSIKYRAGAQFTCPFGLTDGYRIVRGNFVWDTIRIHTGTDRAANRNANGWFIKNIIYSPFDFNYTEIHDYGSDHVYGSLIRLFNKEIGFIFEIIHCKQLKDLKPEIFDKLKSNEPIEKNTVLGKAGNYGSASNGAHTHTNIVSMDRSNKIFDEILQRKYGNDSIFDYKEEEILSIFRSKPRFENESDRSILKKYNKLKDEKRSVGIFNKYRYEFRDWFSNWRIRTRYSSQFLFNGV